MEQAKTNRTQTTEGCEFRTPDYADGTTGFLSAQVASNCCWIPAVAAIFGFFDVSVGQTMTAYHTSLALLVLTATGIAWWFFLSKRIGVAVAWSSEVFTWLVPMGSPTMVWLYSVTGWMFPSVYGYLLLGVDHESNVTVHHIA